MFCYRRMYLALPAFSTTDPICAAAYTGTLMRALQTFFDYTVRTRCGIPEVTLLGTVEDWVDLRTRFLALAEKWMQVSRDGEDIWYYSSMILFFEILFQRTPLTCNWAASVDDFLQHFIAARSGSVDATWWTSLFTYHGSTGSGHSPYVTGHINTLFPWDSANKWTGVQSAKSSFPIGMNSVPLIWVLKKTFFL